MVQSPVKLIHGAGAERVADFGAVEGDPDCGQIPHRAIRRPLNLPVIRQILEIFEASDSSPLVRVEDVGNFTG